VNQGLTDRGAKGAGRFSLDAFGFEPGVNVRLFEKYPPSQLNEGDIPGLYESVKGPTAYAQIPLDFRFRYKPTFHVAGLYQGSIKSEIWT
jgi:hypothetical protein